VIGNNITDGVVFHTSKKDLFVVGTDINIGYRKIANQKIFGHQGPTEKIKTPYPYEKNNHDKK